MPQSLAQVWLHLVFSTKERRPFLNDETFQVEMFRMLAHHVKETGCVSARLVATMIMSICLLGYHEP